MFWTSTRAINLDAKLRYLDYNLSRVIKDSADVTYAFSVRCIKDEISTTTGKNTDIFPVSVSPNPTEGEVQVALSPEEKSEISIQVMTLSGEVVYSGKYRCDGNNFICRIDISEQPGGSYIIRVITKNNSYSVLLIKK